MCIECNVPPYDKSASDFLGEFDSALHHMKKASQAMLHVSKVTYPEYKKQYDKMHKRMVRITREWAQIEHEREKHVKDGPSTLAQQVAAAQSETATWPPGMLERVLPGSK